MKPPERPHRRNDSRAARSSPSGRRSGSAWRGPGIVGGSSDVGTGVPVRSVP
ncbi:hypothetical protein MF672_028585 [Actinomadura sp. ATCC 31491]|uniref:Uncharacterized protein n=1 Tax=Actinomadura luzonensis TaxID=2805427 RepID=A0ABT0FZD8_9ACTN|nr:hypothetical protein [Actinomadura luzonensis]MCK2217721.1 hypothetical protein [Actinomadura luzonensis]